MCVCNCTAASQFSGYCAEKAACSKHYQAPVTAHASFATAPIAPDTAPAANSTSGRGSTASAASGLDTSSLPAYGRPSLASTAASSKLATGAARRGRTGRGAKPAALQLTQAAFPPSLRCSGSASSGWQLQQVAGGALFRRRLNSTLISRTVVLLHNSEIPVMHVSCGVSQNTGVRCSSASVVERVETEVL